MKNKKINVFITSILFVVVISLSTIQCFCASSSVIQPIPYDETITEIYNPSFIDANVSYLGDNSVRLADKILGAYSLRSNIQGLDGELRYDEEFDIYFNLYIDDNTTGSNIYPRVNIGFAQGNKYNETTGGYYSNNLCGFNIAYDFQNGYIITWSSSGYTIDYGSRNSYYYNTGFDTVNNSVSFKITWDVSDERGILYCNDSVSGENWKELNYLTGEYFEINQFSFGTYDALTDGNNIVLLNPFIENYGDLIRDFFDRGYNEGYYSGYTSGKGVGYASGFEEGYAEGVINGSENEIQIPSIITAVTTSTMSIAKDILNFNLFGINIFAVVTTITTIFVVIWLIKKVR